MLSHCLGVAQELEGGEWRGEHGLSEHCSTAKGMTAGGCQTAMLLASGLLEWRRAEWVILMFATVTYCIANLEGSF